VTVKTRPGDSPNRGTIGPDYSASNIARQYYKEIVNDSTKKLMDFLSTLSQDYAMAVTYFDEAHNLDLRFWILLGLLYNQPPSVKMWYAFMGTKSHVTYYAPRPADSQFLPLVS
jgi:hypothetical protein